MLAKRAGVGRIQLQDKYAIDPLGHETRIVEEGAIFAHVPGAPAHQIRKRTWQKLLAKWNKTQYLVAR